MIEVEDVSVAYGNEVVLDHFNLTLETRSATAIVGRSGCGKTTLLKVLSGLLTPREGSVRVEGQRLTGVRPGTGLILQSLGLFAWKTVAQNVSVALEPLGVVGEVAKVRVAAALADLNLTAVAGKFPGQLSGGQAQRAAIARTLVRRPDLLLMDEPSASLDALTREDFQDMVLDLHSAQPSTLVVVTHGIEEAVVLGQTIVVMAKASPPQRLVNPLFGLANPRSDPGFGPFCQEIRRALR